MIAAVPPANQLRVRVVEPLHLCRVQAATRKLCRSIGLDEGAVFSAVIAVTEATHRFFIESGRTGDVEFAIVRRKNGLRLKVRAEREGPGVRGGFSLTFPPLRGPLYN